MSYLIIGIIATIILVVIIVAVTIFILKRMKGSIEIVPEKYNYSSGENINGKLILKIKKPSQASKLIVGLKCERIEKNYSTSSINSRAINIYDFNQPLDGEKSYSPSEYDYDFSITAPQNVAQKLDGMAGSLLKSAQLLMNQNTSFKWYLYAELQCEGINLKKQVQINIT